MEHRRERYSSIDHGSETSASGRRSSLTSLAYLRVNYLGNSTCHLILVRRRRGSVLITGQADLRFAAGLRADACKAEEAAHQQCKSRFAKGLKWTVANEDFTTNDDDTTQNLL
jgi:hypothetical protein